MAVLLLINHRIPQFIVYTSEKLFCKKKVFSTLLFVMRSCDGGGSCNRFSYEDTIDHKIHDFC